MVKKTESPMSKAVQAADLVEKEVFSSFQRKLFGDAVLFLKRKFKDEDDLKEAIVKKLEEKGMSTKPSGLAELVFESDDEIDKILFLNAEGLTQEQLGKRVRIVDFIMSLPNLLLPPPVKIESLQDDVKDRANELVEDSLGDDYGKLPLERRVDLFDNYLEGNFSGYVNKKFGDQLRSLLGEYLDVLSQSKYAERGLLDVFASIYEMKKVIDEVESRLKMEAPISGESETTDKVNLEWNLKVLKNRYSLLPNEKKIDVFTSFLNGGLSEKHNFRVINLMFKYLEFVEDPSNVQSYPASILSEVSKLRDEVVEENGTLYSSGKEKLFSEYVRMKVAGRSVPLFDRLISGKLESSDEGDVMVVLKKYVDAEKDGGVSLDDYAAVMREVERLSNSVDIEAGEFSKSVEEDGGNELVVDLAIRNNHALVFDYLFGEAKKTINDNGPEDFADYLDLLLDNLNEFALNNRTRNILLSQIASGEHAPYVKAMAIVYRNHKNDLPVQFRDVFKVAYKKEFGLLNRVRRFFKKS